MLSRALLKYTRTSSKRSKIVADLVRGKNAEEALHILANTQKKAAEIISDVVHSAASNAKNKFPDKNYNTTDFYISKITTSEGPALKRFRAASMGRASMIKKRTCHVLVELDLSKEKVTAEKDAKKKTTAKKKTIKAKGKK